MNPSRDKELLPDVKAIGAYLEKETTIGLNPPLLSNWSLIGYLQRYYFINVENAASHKYIITDRNSPIEGADYRWIQGSNATSR